MNIDKDKPISRVDSPTGSSIEELIVKFCNSRNPVTRWSYETMIKKRLEQAKKTGELQ